LHPEWVLTEEERERLYESSIKFVAETTTEALSVAHDLQFLVEHGHPSNMCGPLAVAILRDAGLVDEHIILHDFWLLNPAEPWDVRLLESVFPASRYDSPRTSTPIDQFDFVESPLEPGDFLYLFGGLGGTFDHVITVTNVDEEGRAFSVTNVNSDEGFVIKEILLYDPNQPGVGMFYEWADPANIHLGLTGLGGFRLWRARELLRLDGSEMSGLFRDHVDGELANRGGHWRVLVRRTGGEIIYYRRAEEEWVSPIAVQIPAAMLFFKTLDQQGIGDYDSYIRSNGVQDRTFRQMLEAMLVDSEEAAAQAMAWWINERVDGDEFLQGWGLHHTGLKPCRSTAWDVAVALEGLYDRGWVPDEARALILELMGERSDGTNVYRQVFVKGAWPVVGHTALVETERGSYILVAYGHPAGYGEKETDLEGLEEAMEEVASVFVDSYLGR
jgi:hypothetical protein